MSNNSAAFFPRATVIVFSLGFVLLILLVIKDKMWERQADAEESTLHMYLAFQEN